MCPASTACPRPAAPFCVPVKRRGGSRSWWRFRRWALSVSFPEAARRAGKAGPATLRPLSQGRRRPPLPMAELVACAGRRRVAERVLRTGHRSAHGRGPLDLRLPLPRAAIGPAGGHAAARGTGRRGGRLLDHGGRRNPRAGRGPGAWARSWSADGWSIAAANSWPVSSNDRASPGAAA